MSSAKIDKGVVAAILAPFFIALSIILTKMAGNNAPPLVIASIGPLLSVPILFTATRLLKVNLGVRNLLTTLRVPFFKVVLSRSILGQGLIISGFTMTTAIKAVLLLRLEPLFVFIWSILYRGEKPKALKLLMLTLLIVGSALVVAPQGATGGPNIGDALVVTSLLFLSYSYLPTEEVVKAGNPGGFNIMANLFGGLTLLAVAAVLNHEQLLHLSVKAFAYIAGYSVVFFGFALSLYLYAFKTLKPWVIASFLSLEVVFGLIQAHFMLHETMAPLQLCGAVVVLAATFAIGRLPAETTADPHAEAVK